MNPEPLNLEPWALNLEPISLALHTIKLATEESIISMSESQTEKYDICIIGAGLAGLAATLFAANRGLSCVEVGQTGEINFSSGLIDLLGVHPAAEKHAWTDPWAGIDALVRDIPQHPYARLTTEDIQTAFEEILDFLKEAGLSAIIDDLCSSLDPSDIGQLAKNFNKFCRCPALSGLEFGRIH